MICSVLIYVVFMIFWSFWIHFICYMSILITSCQFYGFFYSLLLELQGDTSAALEAYETMLGSMETTSDLTEVWCR